MKKFFLSIGIFLFFSPLVCNGADISIKKIEQKEQYLQVSGLVSNVEKGRYQYSVKGVNKKTKEEFSWSDNAYIGSDWEFYIKIPLISGYQDYDFIPYIKKIDSARFLSESKLQDQMNRAQTEAKDYSQVMSVFTETYNFYKPGTVRVKGSVYTDGSVKKILTGFLFWPQNKEDEVFITGLEELKSDSNEFYYDFRMFDDQIWCYKAISAVADENNIPIGQQIPSKQTQCFSPPISGPPIVIMEDIVVKDDYAVFQASIWVDSPTQKSEYWFEYWEKDKIGLENIQSTLVKPFAGSGMIPDEKISIEKGKTYCMQGWARRTKESYATHTNHICFPGEFFIPPGVGIWDFRLNEKNKTYSITLTGKVYEKSSDNYKVWVRMYDKASEELIPDSSNNKQKIVKPLQNFTFYYLNVPIGKKYCVSVFARKENGGGIGESNQICFPDEAPAVVSESYDLDNSGVLTMKASVWGDEKNYLFKFKYYEYDNEAGAQYTDFGEKNGDGLFLQEVKIKNYSPNKFYCFVPMAKNIKGHTLSYGDKVCFPKIPFVRSEQAGKVSYDKAYLMGRVVNDDKKSDYFVRFLWGEKGRKLENITMPAEWKKQNDIGGVFGKTITNLKADTEYCYAPETGIYIGDKMYHSVGNIKCFKTLEKPAVHIPDPAEDQESGDDNDIYPDFECSSEAYSYNSFYSIIKKVAMAKAIGKAHGVRPQFMLAIMMQETGLGENLGGCYYNPYSTYYCNPRPNNWVGLPNDRYHFKNICARFGFDWTKMAVSCPAGGYGGAMGYVQFMPYEWEQKKYAVSRATGHNPASPWNMCDAMTAKAIYLRQLGAKYNGNGEWQAANDYCGSCPGYANQVVSKTRCNEYYWKTPWRLLNCIDVVAW